MLYNILVIVFYCIVLKNGSDRKQPDFFLNIHSLFFYSERYFPMILSMFIRSNKRTVNFFEATLHYRWLAAYINN